MSFCSRGSNINSGRVSLLPSPIPCSTPLFGVTALLIPQFLFPVLQSTVLVLLIAHLHLLIAAHILSHSEHLLLSSCPSTAPTAEMCDVNSHGRDPIADDIPRL